MLALVGCTASNSGVREVIRRDIPGPPSYLSPVIVPEPKAGEDVLVIAGRERAGRLKANRIILGARSQWKAMQQTYRRTK